MLSPMMMPLMVDPIGPLGPVRQYVTAVQISPSGNPVENWGVLAAGIEKHKKLMLNKVISMPCLYTFAGFLLQTLENGRVKLNVVTPPCSRNCSLK